LVQKISRIKVYNAPALTFLLYGSENRTRKKKDEKRLTSIEIKFFRRTAAPVHPVSEEQQQRYTLFQKNSSTGTPCFRRTAAAVHPVSEEQQQRYTLFQKNSSSGTPCFRRTVAAVHPVSEEQQQRYTLFGRERNEEILEELRV